MEFGSRDRAGFPGNLCKTYSNYHPNFFSMSLKIKTNRKNHFKIKKKTHTNLGYKYKSLVKFQLWTSI